MWQVFEKIPYLTLVKISNSFLDLQNFSLPYLTLDVTFVPYMTFRYLFHQMPVSDGVNGSALCAAYSPLPHQDQKGFLS
jgi:hypothetical protein